MRVLITGGESPLGGALAASLAGEHAVRLVVAGHAEGKGGTAIVTGVERVIGDLREPEFSARAVDGMEAVLHLAPLWPGLPADATDQEVLDHATRGTYVLLNAAVQAGARRMVLASTLDLFERYPAGWSVGEGWQPLPSTHTWQLAAYLAEASAREISRVEPLQTVCLRLGRVVGDEEVAGRSYDPRWLHVEDAVQAFGRALALAPNSRQPGTSGPPQHGWWVYHIPGGGRWTRVPLAAARGEAFGYAPTHDFADAPGSDRAPSPSTAEATGDLSLLAPKERILSRPIRNIVVFGGGGPLASATTPLLTASYVLRVTDLRPIRAIVKEAKPQSPGAPLPAVLKAPHEQREVDVTDPEQVLAACKGMDAIVNCTVLRPHPVEAFRVNFLGAYNIMRAAVAHRIRRVVQTGPQLVTMDRPGGYWWDFDVPDDAPPRPGSWLYGHTKYLGQEVCRIFAEEHDLEVAVLLYSSFVDPQTAKPRPDGVFAMSVSWEDAGHAMRRALEVPILPSPFEVFHILADLPHGKYSNKRAKQLLGWQPRDTLAHLWARRRAPDQVEPS